MRIPEIAYRYLRAIDTAGPTLEVWTRHSTDAGTAASRSITHASIPKNKILILFNVTMVATPGATQSVTSINFTATTPAGLGWNVCFESFEVEADARRATCWNGEVWIGGRGEGVESITATAGFDAGVASNALTASFQGIVVPKANVASF